MKSPRSSNQVPLESNFLLGHLLLAKLEIGRLASVFSPIMKTPLKSAERETNFDKFI